MRVSVIIPVYNVEPYIATCIQSVMRQTYQGELECILVDDCGTDNSMEIAEKLISDYQGPIEFRILHHEHNRGLSAARNTGTAAAKGDYIYFLDSDDEISPNCIELMANVVLKHPQVEVVQGGIESIPYKKFYDLELYKTSRYVEDNKWIRFNAFKQGERLPVNATNKLLKKTFLANNSLAFKEGLENEDELWSFLMYKLVKNWAVIGNKTYIHYLRPNSIMATLTNEKRAENCGIILSEELNNIDRPLRDLQVLKCLDFFIQFVFPHAVNKGLVKRLCLRFIFLLLFIGQFKLALWFVVGFFNKPERRKLFNEMIPATFEKTSNKYNKLFGDVQIVM